MFSSWGQVFKKSIWGFSLLLYIMWNITGVGNSLGHEYRDMTDLED
jgi:hypothetical protein